MIHYIADLSFYENPNHYASFVIFQIYKNVVLRSVHSLGCASFDYVFTHYNMAIVEQ
jgi:hypothetical protein